MDLITKIIQEYIPQENYIDVFGEVNEEQLVKNKIGFLPLSVLKPNWQLTTKLKNIIGDFAEEREILNKTSRFPKAKTRTSIFNPHLALMILKAYCPDKANIFDPFAGGGTRGFIAKVLGYNYLGIELRENEVERIKKQQNKLNIPFDIIIGDSTKYKLDRKFNFSYTCPPYYNLEVYSELPEDLSAKPTYKEFLIDIEKVIVNTYNLLEDNSYCVWIVGNFRNKDGELIPFDNDIISIFIKTGFKLHDELVFWGASDLASMRVGNFLANQKSVRVHEYILIFKK